MSGLIVESVTKQFPTRTEPLVVLRETNLRLTAGQNVAILGPSGSGKSTLLHILGTLDHPTSGSVELDGTDPFQLDEHHLAEFRNRHIGFVFQDHHLLPQLSALENVLVPTVADGRPSRTEVERARALLDRVGLGDRLDHRPAELSGGERQRVGVARALIRQPKLLLANEPTGNLDRHSAASVGQLLVELQQQENAMLVVVTHSPELANLLDQRYELVDGTLQASS
jgi:lipoprotein-releasing system ATP-binding protein